MFQVYKPCSANWKMEFNQLSICDYLQSAFNIKNLYVRFQLVLQRCDFIKLIINTIFPKLLKTHRLAIYIFDFVWYINLQNRGSASPPVYFGPDESTWTHVSITQKFWNPASNICLKSQCCYTVGIRVQNRFHRLTARRWPKVDSFYIFIAPGQKRVPLTHF